MTTEESTAEPKPQWFRIHYRQKTINGRPAYTAEIVHPNPLEPEFLCHDHDRSAPFPSRGEAKNALMAAIRPQHLAGQLYDRRNTTSKE